MRFKPMGDRIILERADQDIKSPGGIIIPDAAKEKPQEGIVSEVGPEVCVMPGDRVLFSKYAGTEFILDNEEYLIIREDDILGIIKEEV